jgi:acetamidase/formamidase
LSVLTGESITLSFLRQEITGTNVRTGGQIGNNDSADDIKNVDLTKVHYLSGPFEVEGAAPGDVLLVEIMDVQPFQDQSVPSSC